MYVLGSGRLTLLSFPKTKPQSNAGVDSFEGAECLTEGYGWNLVSLNPHALGGTIVGLGLLVMCQDNNSR